MAIENNNQISAVRRGGLFAQPRKPSLAQRAHQVNNHIGDFMNEHAHVFHAKQGFSSR